ncbi:MAG: hypothetical protein WCM76_14675 [Bacteroidota bacterium]
MESSIGSGKSGKRKEKAIIFLICLVIAVATWLLIKLSKTYYTVGQFSVEYVNLPPDWAFSARPDSILYLNMKTEGYRIIHEKLFVHQHKIFIDISGLKPIKNGQFYEASVNSADLAERISAQVGDNYQIMNITPHTMFFKFEKAETKKVKVKLNYDISYGQQYGLYHQILFDPDSVQIKGPHDLVSGIHSAETEEIAFSGLTSGTWCTVPVKMPAGADFAANPSYIKVFIPVAEFTESDFDVPVVIDSLPKGLTYKIFPEKVKVRILAPMHDLKEMASPDFTASLNYFEILNKEKNKAKVSLVKVPKYTKVVSIVPDKVEFLIQK